PLRDGARPALIQLRNVDESESIAAAMNRFADRLGAGADVHLGIKPANEAMQRALAAADTARVVVVALYLRLQAGRGEAGLFDTQEDLVRRLLATEQPVVLVTFGNPYAVLPFDDAEALLVAYEQSIESVTAAAAVLRGEQAPRGRLPITVGPYAYGSGLERAGL
ncbi:MAG: glycoside hydrolase family 3 C-terminal domain-containing protein, partial [Rhodothermales bacterium]|nr:glycoside hydrolase family 3 C-terminal domain-containing protein [Rhodothermales bacterium]